LQKAKAAIVNRGLELNLLNSGNQICFDPLASPAAAATLVNQQ
jgi:hypothetical protein